MDTEKKLKSLVIAMSAVAIILAVVLVWVWTDKNSVVKELSVDKDQLTEQLGQLKTDYESLTTNNDSLNTQLERERIKVEELIERVKKTDA